MESLAEEFDNFAQGQNLLDPCWLVLSRFAGHELSSLCDVIRKMANGKYGCYSTRTRQSKVAIFPNPQLE
jgi:hypothetical protein